MNLLSGQIEEIYVDDGMTMGKINIRGAILKASLTFVMNAKVGDIVLIESGVAISKTEREQANRV